MSKDKCKIYKQRRKLNLDCTGYDEDIVEVTGNDLNECKEVFDKVWEEKNI